jgi:hypothetical protein
MPSIASTPAPMTPLTPPKGICQAQLAASVGSVASFDPEEDIFTQRRIISSCEETLY